MFKRHNTNTPSTLFTGFGQTLGSKKIKRLEDKNSWDNIFREHLVEKIDEDVLSVLYSSDNGRPNASIKILIAMMALKEGFGWSDSELYEQCRFNLIVMNALGLSNVSDEVPVESTYYELRRRLYEHEIKTGKSLIAEVFASTTKVQAEIFEVNAKWIRMDSKLIGSNIAKCSRLQLVINCLQEFYKSLDEGMKKKISEGDRTVLEELLKKKSYQIVYKLEDQQKSELLKEYGLLLSRILELFKDDYNQGNKGIYPEKYLIIERVYNDQYKKDQDGKTTPRSNKEISADALQSAYDTYASYKNKDGKGIKGMSVNVTETCNKNSLNLIVGVDLKTATTGDPEFLIEGINQAEEVAGVVEQVSVDGAYHSQINQRFSEEKGIKLHLGGLPGNTGNYDFEFGEQIKVRNNITGEEMIGTLTALGHCGIKESNGNVRYFEKKQLENYKRRKQIESAPEEIRNVRCNIEATIFQSCLHLRKDKTKYRGHFRNKLWINCRALWLNLTRIKKHVERQNLSENFALSM